jgi:hypothetical protein
MTTTQDGRPGTPRRRDLRFWLVLGLVAAIIVVIVGIAAVWFVFFSSQAPPAPTLQDALSVLGTPAPAE